MPTHFQKTNQRKSVLERNSSYRANCSAGFVAGLWQAHHVACHHSVAGRDVPSDTKEYVEDCLWITEWDLNASDNLIGLPVNRQYRMSNGLVPVNMCSHQVDHNVADGYTEEVTKWLKDNLWDTLKKNQKTHDVEAKDIAATLKTCSATFKAHLAERGSREGGTIVCWQNRFDPSYEKKWYHPFSMAVKPCHRHPGVNSSVWDQMVGVFMKLS